MTQFGMFRNPGRSSEVGFVVQVQSSRLGWSMARLVMPLIRRRSATPEDSHLTPHMTVLGRLVYADPFGMAAIHTRRLGQPLTILAEPDQDRIIRAIDELISRA